MPNKSNILKYALFATGVAGIVAEYILSTLATYFLGDSVFQWTIIVSTMLFSMGIGSRISRYIKNFLLEKFIFIEFTLSILASFSAIFVYYFSAFTNATGFFIYFLAIIIGILIGLEIPLVTRLNEQFEELRVNIATVMEKDYYGCLAGGLFFAFIGLPFLGMTYTPFFLGFINFLVAVFLFIKLSDLLDKTYLVPIKLSAMVVTAVLVLGFIFAKPIILFGEQAKYKDKVIFSKQSRYQNIVITQWQDDYWLFINGNQQLSTFDEWLYHEPLVLPVMELTQPHHDVLILGGGDGCAAREVLKYDDVAEITIVDIDPVMTELGQNNSILVDLNRGSMNHPKIKIRNTDAFKFIEETKKYFDVIIIDLPDPKSIDIGRLYSLEFYQLCSFHLRQHGIIITQAGSPYYATNAFQCIELTMSAAGLNTIPIHNQVLTLGEWGWIIGSKSIDNMELKSRMLQLEFTTIETQWLTNEAMKLITSFGKPLISDTSAIEINTLINPSLYRYYLKGNWDIY